jgi:hypothetical protein
MHRAISFAVILLLVAGISGSLTPLSAQDVSAAIIGTVTDPSGAPINGAEVTASDADRGTTWTAKTNDSGVYNLPRVPVGNYTVKVTAKGFQTAVRPPFTLVLNQAARLDFQMKLGQVAETVEVTGSAPLLKTETGQLDTVIDSRTNVALPLATRNYIQLTLLAPGSIHPDPSTVTSPQNIFSAGRPYINGNREQANNFLLDGMDNNQVSDNLVGFTPSVDAIQEFNMITQNASAEFGNFQGGIVSTTIKSGTNSLHGDVFEFFRNDKLNANKWENGFDPANVVPKPKLRWNMFGGTVGGPIVKNKLFFFADYQGQRFDHPSSTSAITLFTAAERQGDFSQLLAVKGIQLYNPCNPGTGVPGVPCTAPATRVPFPNNQIPVNMINPVAQALFSSSLYPLPTTNTIERNFLNTTHSALNGDQGDVKVDFNMSGKDRLSGRYSQAVQDNPGTNSFKLFFDSFGVARLRNGVLNWTHTFGPNVLNEARVGVNYVFVNNGGVDNGLGNVGQDLGIANANDHGPGLLALNFTGGVLSNFGTANVGTQQLFVDTVIQYDDGLVIQHGHHSIHTGFQFWRDRVNSFYAGNNGRTGFMGFSGRFTGPTGGATVGAGEADFFLGMSDSFGRGVGNTDTWHQRANVIAGYFQDDWRATNTLTLNLGLRYETHTPWVEVDDEQTNFSPFSGVLLAPNCSKVNLGPAPVTCQNSQRALYNSHNGGRDFQPRFGFAWTPAAFDNKTVIRGAFTISSYLEGTGTNLRLTMNPPFTIAEFSHTYTGNVADTTIDQGLLPPAPPPAGDPYTNALIRLWDPEVQPAITQQWNLSVQHQFSNTTTAQVGYVGQHGTHLMVPMPYLQKQLHSDGTITPSPYLGGNPALQTEISQISGTASVGSMSYNALQATLQKRFSGGLQYQVAYTYSKCLTDSSGYYGSWGGQTTPTSPYFQNLYDPRAEWGPCYYDTPHTLTSYAVYDLPFGHGKKFGHDVNSVANAVLGNWQLSGILSLHGGFPLTISANDNSGTNSRGARADCNAPPHYLKTDIPTGGIQWFDPSPYSQPASGFGTCGVGTVRGPGLRTFDLSVQKQFLFTETKRLEFRTEFINFVNHPILNSAGAGLGASLGQVTSSQGERNIQMALKFYF